MGWTFSPPVTGYGPTYRADADRVTQALWGHFRGAPEPTSVLKNGDTYTDQSYVYSDDIDAADVFYQGGHIYEVTAAEAADLARAGYFDGRALVDYLPDRQDIPFNVLAIGDSNTEQIAANYLDPALGNARWTNLLQDLIRDDRGVTGGVGYQAADDRTGFLTAAEDTVISGTAFTDYVLSSGSGFGYKAVRLVTATGTVTWPARTCDWIRVYYSAILGAGTLIVKVGGSTVGTIDCGSSAASSQDHWVDFPLGSSASRVVSVEWGSTGTLGFPFPTVCGVQFFDGPDDRPSRAYLHLDGSSGAHSSTPDHASLDLTGNVIEWYVKVYIPDPTGASEQYTSARGDSSADKRSWINAIDVNGRPKLYWSTDGLSYSNATSTGDPLEPGTYWMKRKLTLDNGGGNREVEFWTSQHADDLATDDYTEVANWTQHGSTVTGAVVASPLYGTDIAMRVGTSTFGLNFLGQLTGDVFAFALLDDGVEVATPIFARNSNKRFRDSAGKVWTASGGATHELDDTGAGWVVINAGHSGARVSTFSNGTDIATGSTAQATSDLSDWFTRQPIEVVILVMSGTNDYGNDDDPEDFRVGRQAVIDEIRSVEPDIPIIHVIMPTPTLTGVYPYSLYADIARDQADVDGRSTVIDLVEEWPQPGTVEGTASGLYYDGTPHLSAAVGHPTLAARLAVQILEGPIYSTELLELVAA